MFSLSVRLNYTKLHTLWIFALGEIYLPGRHRARCVEAGLPLALGPGAPTAAGPEVVSPPRGACSSPSCRPGHTHLGELGPASGQRPGTRPFLRLPRCPAPGLLAVSLLCLPARGHRVRLGPPPSARQPMSLRGLRSLGLLPWIRGRLLPFSLARSATGFRHGVRRGREGSFNVEVQCFTSIHSPG